MTLPRTVLAAAADALRGDASDAVLAVAVDTEGSTYAHTGAMALFGGPQGQVGWLSGGCLEPEIARVAEQAAQAGALAWMDIDTRDDEDLLSGSAVGCRGRLHLALWPLAGAQSLQPLIADWLQGHGGLRVAIDADGGIQAQVDAQHAQWRLPVQGHAAAPAYAIALPAPPRLVVLGGGPEAPSLLPLLCSLGWRVVLVERRPRWRGQGALADEAWDLSPADAVARLHATDTVLVMHHHFELDREALAALAARADAQRVDYVGLLGPTRRRDDLFRVLSPAAREALRGSLRSPVGMPLGGQGPEAIALSIAAQLQAHRHGRAA